MPAFEHLSEPIANHQSITQTALFTHPAPATMSITIRLARPEDAPLLPDVERSAAQAFVSQPDLAFIASSPTLSVEEHLSFILQQREWLAVDAQDRPLGFLCGQDCGAHWHIVELSVQQSAQGQGLGRRLIGEAAAWAREQGYAGLSLTTFTSVPWNAPFYARLGFKQLDRPQLSEFLQRQLATEASHGLPDRCAMRLDFKAMGWPRRCGLTPSNGSTKNQP